MKYIYYILPVFVQNLGISIFRYKLRRQRYGSDYKKIVKGIDLSLSPRNEALDQLVTQFGNLERSA
jgi:hypothetical protein